MTLEELEILKKTEIQDLIKSYSKSNPTDLVLKNKIKSVLPPHIIAEQVLLKQKAEIKFPSLNKNDLIFTKLAFEQASSQLTAEYKSTLIKGNNLIDLTGGLGIDEVFFASSFNSITYCEIDEVTSKIAKHNFLLLGINNIKVKNTDSIKYINEKPDKFFDWIYIDPSRRDGSKRSVDLEYCAPNVYQNIDLLLRKGKNIMIKVAPAFDLSEAIRRFKNLQQIHVVSVNGECKEILLLLDSIKINNIPEIFSISLSTKRNNFNFSAQYQKKREKKISEIKSYFYEPDCALIKSELSPILQNSYDVSFINKNVPYLTSEIKYNNFPGRKFVVKEILLYNEKALKKYFKKEEIKKANVAKRNFIISVNEIRKRFKLKDGGNLYLFFTKNNNDKSIVIICERL